MGHKLMLVDEEGNIAFITGEYPSKEMAEIMGQTYEHIFCDRNLTAKVEEVKNDRRAKRKGQRKQTS